MATNSYDVSNKINIYEQITKYSCAVTCACMSLKRSPETMQADGISLNWADWNNIADTYGYNVYDGTASLKGVIEILKKGYPAITQVNTGNNQHWVDIISFDGDEDNPKAGDFECADPAFGDTRNLTKAGNYSSIYLTKYFTGK